MRILTDDESRAVSGAGYTGCYEPPKGKQKGNNGFGNGGNDGVPGGSDKQDDTR